jgi:transposase
MLTLPSAVHVYLAADPTDLRKGFDGLAAATRHLIRQDPLSGHLFVFLNRRRDRMKILVWQSSGFLLLYKRLERGTFKLAQQPAVGERSVRIDAADLALMLEGIDLRGARRRKHWAPPNSVATSIGP